MCSALNLLTAEYSSDSDDESNKLESPKSSDYRSTSPYHAGDDSKSPSKKKFSESIDDHSSVGMAISPTPTQDSVVKRSNSPSEKRSKGSLLVSYGNDMSFGELEGNHLDESVVNSSSDSVQPFPQSGEEETDDKKVDITDESVGNDGAAVIAMDLDESDEENEESSKSKRHISESSGGVETWCDGLNIPPEPVGQCDPHLQAQINRLYRMRVEQNYDLNRVIQNKKSFRNPSIYEKLIEFCDIDEHGTNLPAHLYDGHLFGADSYFDVLAKVQMQEWEKREKAQKAAAATSAALVASKISSCNKEGRSSKWDLVGGSKSGVVVPPTVVVSTTTTTSGIPKIS